MRSFLALGGAQGLGALNVSHGLGPLANPPPPSPPKATPRVNVNGGAQGITLNYAMEWMRRAEQEEREREVAELLRRPANDIVEQKKIVEEPDDKRIESIVEIAKLVAKAEAREEFEEELKAQKRRRLRKIKRTKRRVLEGLPQTPILKRLEREYVYVQAQAPTQQPTPIATYLLVAAIAAGAGLLLGWLLFKASAPAKRLESTSTPPRSPDRARSARPARKFGRGRRQR